MKKWILFFMCSFLFCACTFERAYTFAVNDELIDMNLDGEWSCKQQDDLITIDGDDFQISGMFIPTETYDLYVESIPNDESATVLEQDRNHMSWTVTGDSGKEVNCVYRISADTSFIMGSLDDVGDVYEQITFTVS